jgi:hypothetical protein
VIGLSAALEWLAQSDIGQAENWSRSLASWRKRRWRNGRASALSAASSQACWPLILTVFITAIW